MVIDLDHRQIHFDKIYLYSTLTLGINKITSDFSKIYKVEYHILVSPYINSYLCIKEWVDYRVFKCLGVWHPSPSGYGEITAPLIY